MPLHLRLAPILIACACTSIDVRAQTEEAMARFEKLSVRHKAVVVLRLRREAAALRDPVIARIHDLAGAVDRTQIAAAEERPYHDPKKWCASAPIARELVPATANEHRLVRERFPARPFLASLHTAFAYDWRTGHIVRVGDGKLDYDDIFANFVRGYAPDTDLAVAEILRRLDCHAPIRPVAAWFEHLYANLDGHVYAGVTLYEAWYSGEVVMVPDTDSVPFAHLVLGDDKVRTPVIGRVQARVYEEIKQHALAYRIYKTTRQAAAAAFVQHEPDMDEMYGLLVPRFHYLFAKHEDNIEKIGELLLAENREAILYDVDAKIREYNGEAWKLQQKRELELKNASVTIRNLALRALDDVDK